MPKYTAVAPTFTPIDYATRIKPLEQYKEEYDKRMDALDEQGVLADAIGGLIDENQDPELARVYKDYSDKMNSTANNLLQTGDLGSSRRALGELRRDYANKLVPIQQAYNSRAEAGKAFRDIKRKDPSYKGNDPLQNSLSSYMHGNMPDEFGISGDKVYNETFADAKAQMSRMRDVIKDWGLDTDRFNGQYFVEQIASGYKAEDVTAALAKMAGKSIEDIATQKDIEEMSDAYKYIQGTLNRAYSGFGVDNLKDEKDREYIMTRALNGALAGMSYDVKEDVKENKDFLTKYQQEILKGQDWNRKFNAALYGYDPKTGTVTGKPKSGKGTERKYTPGLRVYDEAGKLEHSGKSSDEDKKGNKGGILSGFRKVVSGESEQKDSIENQLSPESIKQVADDLSISRYTFRDLQSVEKTTEELANEIRKYLKENPEITIWTTDEIKDKKDGTRRIKHGKVAVDVADTKTVATDISDVRGSSASYESEQESNVASQR